MKGRLHRHSATTSKKTTSTRPSPENKDGHKNDKSRGLLVHRMFLVNSIFCDKNRIFLLLVVILVFVLGAAWGGVALGNSNIDKSNNMYNNSTVAKELISSGFAFEIHGKVQGVSFRKYTQRKANEMNLASNNGTTAAPSPVVVGWIRNHAIKGTVEGKVAGYDRAALEAFQAWLQTTGSPRSRIDQANFHDLGPRRAQALLQTYTNQEYGDSDKDDDRKNGKWFEIKVSVKS